MGRLSEIGVTHISLVKAGANQKTIIYKSSDKDPVYTKNILFKKSDEEKGVVYGIVYSPEQTDTDGDIASADEILKAAYAFMKNKNTTNVDKQHSFKSEDAFVAESWIVKAGDTVFPNEPEGSWAVAIKLESEELKKSVKDGEIAGLSMAGTAIKKEEKPDDGKNFSLADLSEMIKKIFKQNEPKQGEELKKEEIEKALKDAVEPFEKQVKDLNEKVESLEKSNKEYEEALKKSKQDNNPGSTNQGTNIYGGIL